MRVVITVEDSAVTVQDGSRSPQAPGPAAGQAEPESAGQARPASGPTPAGPGPLGGASGVPGAAAPEDGHDVVVPADLAARASAARASSGGPAPARLHDGAPPAFLPDQPGAPGTSPAETDGDLSGGAAQLP